MSGDKDWKPPATARETYKHLAGNKFAGLNQDTSGARTQGPPLPRGSKPYQLYSLNTPNGQKVGIAMEEFAVEYDVHTVNILQGDQFTSGFVDLNPNSRIPALRHHHQPNEAAAAVVDVFESGAILLYLVEQNGGRFFPPLDKPKERAEAYSWLMWQMGGQGPMFGQFGHFFRYAPRERHDVINYGVARYSMEVRRLLSVMDAHLKKQQTKGDWYLGEEYTIVDMALYPWCTTLGSKVGYNAWDFLEIGKKGDFSALLAWMKRMEQRPAVQRGMLVAGPPGASAKLAKLRAEQAARL